MCQIFINELKMGVVGCGVAMTCTNTLMYIGQNYMMKAQLKRAAPAFAIKWNNEYNFQ